MVAELAAALAGVGSVAEAGAGGGELAGGCGLGEFFSQLMTVAARHASVVRVKTGRFRILWFMSERCLPMATDR